MQTHTDACTHNTHRDQAGVNACLQLQRASAKSANYHNHVCAAVWPRSSCVTMETSPAIAALLGRACAMCPVKP